MNLGSGKNSFCPSLFVKDDNMRNYVAIAFIIFAASWSSAADYTNGQVAPDNSAANRPSANGSELTAQDQSNAAWSTNITRKIRADLVGNKSLSTNAKNIKIIVINNRILLKGPVDSHVEIDKILKSAANIAPTHKIDNEMVVTK